jgi:Cu+-exporting ATPase
MLVNRILKSNKRRQVMATTVHDPVCGMDIDSTTAAGTSEYNGQTYYFCSLGCKKAFDENPEKYLGKTDEHAHHH